MLTRLEMLKMGLQMIYFDAFLTDLRELSWLGATDTSNLPAADYIYCFMTTSVFVENCCSTYS